MDTSTSHDTPALLALEAPVRDRLISYRPAKLRPDIYEHWAPLLIQLAAVYGPASAVEAKVTLTALCQLIGHVGEQIAEPSLDSLLCEVNIGDLRAALLRDGVNAGTVNNRIGRLNQLMSVQRGLPRTNVKTPVATQSPAEGGTTPYSPDEVAVLRDVAADHGDLAVVIRAGLDGGVVVPRLTEHGWQGHAVTQELWQRARDVATQAGVSLVGSRLRATWRLNLVLQNLSLEALVRDYGLSSTDLDHVVPAAAGDAADLATYLR